MPVTATKLDQQAQRSCQLLDPSGTGKSTHTSNIHSKGQSASQGSWTKVTSNTNSHSHTRSRKSNSISIINSNSNSKITNVRQNQTPTPTPPDSDSLHFVPFHTHLRDCTNSADDPVTCTTPSTILSSASTIHSTSQCQSKSFEDQNHHNH
eukprot:261659_1